MFRLLSIIIIAINFTGCVGFHKNRDIMDPFVIVVKLNSAESYGNQREAEKYIDISQVYDPNKYIEDKNETVPTPEVIYDQYLAISRKLRGANKFTSEFPYHNYEIRKIFKSNEICEIEFISKEPRKNIIYILNRKSDNWIVIDILRDNRIKERNMKETRSMGSD